MFTAEKCSTCYWFIKEGKGKYWCKYKQKKLSGPKGTCKQYHWRLDMNFK